MLREEGRRLVQTAMSGGLTLMISQYLCQRGLSQQVEGNMSASEAAIREYPAATHNAVCHSLHVSYTDAHEPAKKDASSSGDDKPPSDKRVMFIRTVSQNPPRRGELPLLLRLHLFDFPLDLPASPGCTDRHSEPH